MNEIKRLYGGDFIPCEQFNSRPPRYVELVKQIEEKEKSLSVGFSEEQKQILKQIQDHYIELAGIEGESMFDFTFRYAFRLAAEIFTKEG